MGSSGLNSMLLDNTRWGNRIVGRTADAETFRMVCEV